MSASHLSTDEVRAFYDGFGAKQDTQAFYEDAALDRLCRHGAFGEARHVFEFGCGTGRFAEILLTRDLSPDARYSGCDLSPVMIGLARDRLARFGPRVHLWQSDGLPDFSPAGEDVDRIVTTYVLDLLADADITAFLEAAAATLRPGGLLCTVTLTRGTTLPSRVVSTIWAGVAGVWPRLVGGCRPISLSGRLSASHWRVRHRSVVVPWSVPSEIVVAERL